MAEKPAEKPKTPTQASGASRGESHDAKRIEARELREQLSKGNVVVLDMRRDWDQASTKIRSAIRVHPDEYKEYEGSLPRGRTIVSYCT
jgi:predicted sulfurtransferase